MQKEDPTIAELLKPHGYATGQFGKNHLGDRDEFLPTVHGFDEFFGNLYHLNAEEEPEHRNYPRDPEFRKKFGPRGVRARRKYDPTERGAASRPSRTPAPSPRSGWRRSTTRPRTAAIDFIQRQSKAGKPFFCWWNSTRMHLRTHVTADHRSPPGLTARTEYADGMVEHDGHVGQLLKTIDDLGIADDTIVLYTTDNGPHMNSWPDGAMTPFRSEKNTNWEGAFRVPCMIRWPGKIKAGSVSNEIVSGLDWLPTFLAAAGDPDIKEKLLKGHEADGKTFKVHLDGYNQLAYLTGQTDRSAAEGVLLLQRRRRPAWPCGTRTGRSSSWNSGRRARCGSGPSRSPCSGARSSSTCGPTPTSARTSPPTPTTTGSLTSLHSSSARQEEVAKFLATFKEYPPRQRAASFTIDQAMEKLKESIGD